MAPFPASSPRSPWSRRSPRTCRSGSLLSGLALALALAFVATACQDGGVDPIAHPGMSGPGSVQAAVVPVGTQALPPHLGVIGAEPAATCGPTTVARLLEVEGGPVGTVEIATDAATLYVTFRTSGDPEQVLAYTGVAVAGSRESLPFRRSGAPDVGAFPVSPPHAPGSHVITWRIPRALAPGEAVFVSVFAQVGDAPAWAEGTRIANPGVPHTTYLGHAGASCEGEPIGEDGGTASSPDREATVTVPAGAVTEPVEITIEPTTTTLENAVPGTAWEFGPEEITFAEPVTMRLVFDPARIPAGITLDRLRLARIVDGRAEVVPGSGFVPGVNAVEGQVTGFSSWTIVWVPQVDLEVLGPIGFSPTTAVAGQPLEVTAGLRNLSSSVTAANVTIQFRFQGAVFTAAFADLHPDGCASDADPLVQVVTCVMDLGPSEATTRTITVNPWLAGTSINVTAQSGVPIGLQDPIFGNNSASASIDVVSATSADVALTLDPAPTLMSLGGDLIEISGEVRYIQSALETLDGAGVQVELAGMVTVEELEPGCSFADRAAGVGIVVGCFGEMSDGSPLSFRVRGRSTAAPQSIPVTVTATPPFGFTDPNLGNNTQSRTYEITARTTDLSILQFVADQASAVVGEDVLYTFTGQNLGPDALPESRLQFRILSGASLSPLPALPADRTDVSNLVVDAVAVDCVFGPVAGEDGVTPTRSVRVIPTTAGQALEASVEYRVPAIATDPNPANNRRELSTPVPGAQADIRTTIVADPQVARGFVPVTASVIVTNTNIPGVTSVNPVPEMLMDVVIRGGVTDISVPNACNLEFVLGSERTYSCGVPVIELGIAITSRKESRIRSPTTTLVSWTCRCSPVRPICPSSRSRTPRTPRPPARRSPTGCGCGVPRPPSKSSPRHGSSSGSRATWSSTFRARPATMARSSSAKTWCSSATSVPWPPAARSTLRPFSATAEIKPFTDAVDPVPGNNTASQTTTINGVLAEGRVYVGNLGSQSVSVLDASTDALASTIGTTGGPFKLTRRPGSPEIWAANVTGTTRTVQVISTTTDAVVATVVLPAGTNPRDIDFSPDGATAWIVDIGSSRLIEVNASTRGTVATLPMPPAPLSMVISPDGATGYVAATTDTLSVVNLASRTITTKLGGFGNTGGMVMSDDGASSATSLTQFAWAPWALAWSPDRGAFWVAFRDTDQVGRFDATTLAEQWRTPVGSQPITLVVPEN